jgi:hypothetical protein
VVCCAGFGGSATRGEEPPAAGAAGREPLRISRAGVTDRFAATASPATASSPPPAASAAGCVAPNPAHTAVIPAVTRA